MRHFLSLLPLRIYKLVIVITDAYWRKYFLQNRVLPAVEHKYLGELKVDTLVDVGANRGQFAAAMRPFVAKTIHSFEPLSSARNVLSQAFRGDDSLIVYDLALGDKAGKMTFHVSMSEDSSSILEIGDRQEGFYPGTGQADCITIDVERLDGVIASEDLVGTSLLKLDVQGYELPALLGCGDLLGEFNYIYCECSMQELYVGQHLIADIISHLRKNDFDLIDIRNLSRHEGRCIQGDLLFENRREQ